MNDDKDVWSLLAKRTLVVEAAQEFVAAFELALICYEGNDSLMPHSALPAWLELRRIVKANPVERDR